MRSRRTPDIPASVRAEVVRRSGGFCEIDHADCTNIAVHMHHRRLRAQGGRHEAANLLHLCGEAHRMVHANPTLSYEQGWMIRSGQS